jgi:hypothetical protein
MVGTAVLSGTAAPTLPPYASSYQVRFHALASERLNSTWSCGINQTNHGSNAPEPGGRAGSTTQGQLNPQVWPHHLGRPHLPNLARQATGPLSSKGTLEDHVWFEDRWMVASLCDE